MAITHPILALWAHPRSMSTAIERVMRARGDLTVFHEPFMADYYMHRANRLFPMVDTGVPSWVDYPTMRGRILDAAVHTPVFFKDLSFYADAILAGDPDFTRRLTHVFLIRDPRRAIASYWKLDPELTCEEVGLEASWELHQALIDDGQTPLVIEAEAVGADPERQIGLIWDHAGLDARADAFRWQAGEMQKDWQFVAGWHRDVAGSTGIKRDSRDPDTVFDAARHAAPHLEDYLEHHWPFYERLRALARKGIAG